MTSTHTEIIALDLPPMSDQARQAMRARVLAAVRNELDKHHYEEWRDQHLTLLRCQWRQVHDYCPHLPYQSFPDFCREKWDEGEKRRQADNAEVDAALKRLMSIIQ